ncbi:uncharacterized protein LOC124141166 isoform X2 [Haliotis rufescens]|uniref:uncharacterized protein LOC124141166 isoform X2 n=1 Tax=Haliotis rufescens TaxID=6454 RepID=UPI00201F564A|nr:uncharacterized protein LOC124141166 isoform X2 [Haliotis rufescens]
MKKTPKKDGRGHILKGHINLSTVYLYLKSGQYPPGLSDCDKRAVRKRAKSFSLTGEDLYFTEQWKKTNAEDDNAKQTVPRKVLISEEERRKTVLEAHIDPEGTHYGIEKTTNAVSSRYYWVGISHIVRDIIHNCPYCQASRSNVNLSITPSLSRLFGIKQDPEDGDNDGNTSMVSSTPMQLFQSDMEPATYFWEKVELQILGPYMCGRRWVYVAVCLDIFSLWPEVTTLADKSAPAITHFLLNLICRYGVMKSVILRENDSTKFSDVHIRSDLLSKVGIEIDLENFVVTETKEVWEDLENSIATFVSSQPDSWSQCLEVCLMPHRVSRPQRAEYTPAYLAHGREFHMPVDLSHQDANSYIEVNTTSKQKAETTATLMEVHSGYKDVLRNVNAHHRVSSLGVGTTPYVACIEPGHSFPVVKVASVTLTGDEVEKYKQKDARSLPRNTQVKTVSVTPSKPLEKGQKRLVVVSVMEKQLKKGEDVGTGAAGVKMEQDGSDIDDGALSTHDMDPDYASTPCLKRSRRQDKQTSLLQSDRVTRRSGRRTVLPSVAKAPVESQMVMDHPVDRVCSSGMHGLGFGMEDLDAYYSALEQYKVNGKYPDGFTIHQKRVLRKISQSYFLLDSVLYYLQGAKGKKKVVIKTATQRLALLRRAHISDTGSHVCRTKVIDRLDSWNTYWKGLTLDCEAFVRACPSCHHGKERTRSDHNTTVRRADGTTDEDDLDIELDVSGDTDDGLEESYDDLLEYLKKQKYPLSCSKNFKCNLRRKSKSFVLIDSVLHYVSRHSSEEQPRRVLISEEDRTQAIREAHSDQHYGRNKTYMVVRDKYYWKGMMEDITNFVKKCCQMEVRGHATEEELVRRRTHMTDRVNWFREKIASQDADLSGENVMQILMKTEHMETEEVDNVSVSEVAAVKTLVDVSQTHEVHKEMDSHGDRPSHTADAAQGAAGAGALMDRSCREATSQQSERDVPVDEARVEQGNYVIDVKVYSDEMDSERAGSHSVVVESVEPGKGVPQHIPSSQEATLVVDVQTPTNSIVSNSQGLDQSSSPSTSAIIREQGIPVTTSRPSPGRVDMVMVPYDQWNTPDLKMLSDRVRMSNPGERVSVEQIQDQEQSVILSKVNNATMSSGNAFAELVKATVGDLAQEDTVEKVLETASAVASIPDPSPTGDAQMEVDEEEEEEEEDDYAQEEDESDAEKEVKDVDAKSQVTSVPKKTPKFNCEICGKEVKGEVTFKMHMYKHTGIKPFTCEMCPKKFSNNKSLRIHLRKHTGDTPYLCNLCGKGFSRATSLRYHLRAHEEGGGVPVSCDECGRDFTTPSRLDKHKACKHPVEAPVFQCADCGKVFTAQRSLKRHMVSHQGIRQYQCEVCGRGFFRKEYLNSHLAQHPEAFDVHGGHKILKNRPKKKQVVVDLDPNTGLQVQSVVQVAGNQPAAQTSDSTAYVFPQESVQYEVECLTSESTLTEADLKAIHFLAQASIHGQF